MFEFHSDLLIGFNRACSYPFSRRALSSYHSSVVKVLFVFWRQKTDAWAFFTLYIGPFVIPTIAWSCDPPCFFACFDPLSVSGADLSCLRGPNSTAFPAVVKGFAPRLFSFFFGCFVCLFSETFLRLAAFVRHLPVSCSGSYYSPFFSPVKGSSKIGVRFFSAPD